MRVRLLAGPALALVLMSGCAPAGSTAADPLPEPAIGPVPATVDVRTLTLPLDPYAFNARQVKTIDRAISLLSAECLRRFGFAVSPPSIPDPARQGHEGLYGLTDLQDAQRFGYHPGPAEMAARSKEPPLPEGAYAVMHGEVKATAGQQVPEGGCLGEARRKLNSVEQKLSARGVALANRASDEALRDSRVVNGMQKWSDCMRERGHRYRDPWEANDDRRWQATASAEPLEMQVAVADVTCKQSTNLLGIWVTVEAAYQQRALEQNGAALGELKAALENELHHATQTLAGKP